MENKDLFTALVIIILLILFMVYILIPFMNFVSREWLDMCYSDDYCEYYNLGETIYTSDFTNDFYCIKRNNINIIISSKYVNWEGERDYCNKK